MNQRLDELRNLLQEDPGSRRFFLLGDLLRKAGELGEAAEVLTQGLEHHPRYVAAMVSLGRIQLETDQFSDAERSFARALELDPENAVAARLIGETAEKAGELVRAIKAFKLARALTPGDVELEERIQKIERRLAGDIDDGPRVAEEASGIPERGVPVEPVTPPEPFETKEESPNEPDPFSYGVSIRRPREVVSVSEDDPFAMTSTGDTGVWLIADDVFAPSEIPYDSREGDVFGEDLVDEPPHELEPVEDHGVEMVPEPEPEFEPEPVSQSDFYRKLSLPTVTLARLALEQDDQPLAEETLKAILERDPGNREASDLLESLRDQVIPESAEPLSLEPSPSPADLLSAKASRLKDWMENIRTATERGAP